MHDGERLEKKEKEMRERAKRAKGERELRDENKSFAQQRREYH